MHAQDFGHIFLSKKRESLESRGVPTHTQSCAYCLALLLVTSLSRLEVNRIEESVGTDIDVDCVWYLIHVIFSILYMLHMCNRKYCKSKLWIAPPHEN